MGKLISGYKILDSGTDARKLGVGVVTTAIVGNDSWWSYWYSYTNIPARTVTVTYREGVWGDQARTSALIKWGPSRTLVAAGTAATSAAYYNVAVSPIGCDILEFTFLPSDTTTAYEVGFWQAQSRA